jgi:hypothetical protein
MEKVEHAAHITFVARMLGGEKVISAEDIEKLRAISQQSYGKNFSSKIACETGSSNPTQEPTKEVPTDEEIREVVKRMLSGK